MNEHPLVSKNNRSIFQKLTHFFHKNTSKADLREYLQEAQENNIIDSQEATMLEGVLTVSEQKVRDIMVAKSQMVTVEYNLSFNETVHLVRESGHSRFPVEKDEQIIGILLAKDLLCYVKAEADPFDITKIMRPVRLIPESKPLDALLRDFRHQRVHMVVITNEYGDIAGLVTIEDVLEEIVGDIDDEHDIQDKDQIKQLDTCSYLVSALTEVEDFNEVFHTNLSNESSDTIGGHVLTNLGYVPVPGEKTELSGLNFIIKEADARRIISLVVKIPS